MEHDVFISYSRKDSDIAERICSELEKVGVTYFIDRQGIGGGMEFPAVLSKAIRESKVFLFLGSHNSYNSKFTQSEVVYAFNKKQKQDIIPYIIDDSVLPDELEFTFSSINWRRLDEHPIETVLVDDILRKVGKTRPSQTVQESTSAGEQVISAPIAQQTTKQKAKEKKEFEIPIVTKIGLKLIKGLLCVFLFIFLIYSVAAELSLRYQILAGVLFVFSALALFFIYRLERGDKKSYYILCGLLIIATVSSLFADKYLFITMFVLGSISFYGFTLLLKVNKNGQSLWKRLK